MKISDFQKIPQFPRAYYSVDMPWGYLEDNLKSWDQPESGSPVILNPEWQRGHVWSKEQQISYLEFVLMGGSTGNNIYFNCSSWQEKFNTPIYCVDGLQRLTSVLGFVRNEIPAFKTFYKDFSGKLRMTETRLRFNILNLKSKKELLNLYIMFNSGGTIHKPEEIERIKKMMAETPENEEI